MSNYKRGLVVVVALLTVVGMTAVLAAPTGASITSGDGVSSTFDTFSGTSADSGDDHPACDNPGNSSNNSANCTDKDEDEDDEEDEDEEDEDEEDEDEEDEEDDEGGDGQVGTCEEGGAAQNNTFANEAFGTENESGPVSSEIHANEEQFQDAEPLVHEVSCGIATIDNNAAGNDSDDGNESDDGGDGNESNPVEDLIGELEDNAPGNDSDDGNESDDGNDGDEGEVGSCEEGGAAQENTFANEAFGTENESGPVSSEIHANEEQFQDAEPLAHEVSCGIATADNNAP